MNKIRNALITGGNGFVGKKIVTMLLNSGVHCKVIGRHDYPELSKLGVECLVGNLDDKNFVVTNCKDVDVVFHVAAKAGIWGKWQEYYSTNVMGTENIIHACLTNSIENLVYTSTPSVVFNGDDIRGGDEDLPYTENFLCHYARSKVMAEKMVFSSVEKDGLNACAIRPHLVYGPGDPHLVPRLLARGRQKKLKIVGSGENRVDITYIDNVAHLHLLAAENLATTGEAKGQAYFIGDEDPVNLWNWINSLFKHCEIPQITQRISEKTAYAAGFTLECLYKGLRLEKEPPMTRFVAEQLARSHYFSHEKAKRELGYSELVSGQQAMDNLIHWVKKNAI